MRSKVPKKLNKLRGYIGGFISSGGYAKSPTHWGMLVGLAQAYNTVCGDGEQIVRLPKNPFEEPADENTSPGPGAE